MLLKLLLLSSFCYLCTLLSFLLLVTRCLWAGRLWGSELLRMYFYNAWQIYKQKIQHFFRVITKSQRDRTNAFVVAAGFLSLQINYFLKLLHILIKISLFINNFPIFFIVIDLRKLYFYRSASDYSLTLGQKLPSNDTLKQ